MSGSYLVDMPFLANFGPQLLVGLLGLYFLIVKILEYRVMKITSQKNQTLSKKKYISPDIAAENEGEEAFLDDEEGFRSFLPENLPHIPFTDYKEISHEEMLKKSQNFYEQMNRRRTIRFFSKKSFPIQIIENIIKTAEPWTFVVVQDQDFKLKIREIIESEEEINYKKRMGKQWTTDLSPLKTDWHKEYLTDAPYLILVFKQTYGINNDGTKINHYYNEQSTSICTGILLTAIHNANLTTLTSTPLNCGGELRRILNRPRNEKLAILLPIGFPSQNCSVPDLKRKPLQEIMVTF